MSRQDIIEIQNILNSLSYTDPRLVPVFVDGIYSKQTKRAVTVFQTLYGLEPSGEVDSATWDELQAQASDLEGIAPKPLHVFPHPSFILRPGDTHNIAPLIAHMINRLADDYQNIQAVPIQAHYNPQAVNEIRTIQQLHRIEPTGNIDSKTWNMLVTLFENRPSYAQR